MFKTAMHQPYIGMGLKIVDLLGDFVGVHQVIIIQKGKVFPFGNPDAVVAGDGFALVGLGQVRDAAAIPTVHHFCRAIR